MNAVHGTVRAPRFHEGPTDVAGDVRMRQRHFTYQTDEGVVAGCNVNVMFTIDRPARDVWPILQDFNLWQNSHEHYYSAPVGELEGKQLILNDLSLPPEEQCGDESYDVIKVIPEYVLTFLQPVPEGPPPGLPGLGGISPGFHVWMLNEHEGKTTVTINMMHESYASRDEAISDDEALAPWREASLEWQTKWLESFIPTLKKLVDEAS